MANNNKVTNYVYALGIFIIIDIFEVEKGKTKRLWWYALE